MIWSRDDLAFFIEPELHGRLHRRVELHRMVTKLLGAADHNDPECGYRSWASCWQAGDGTPGELVEAGGDGYRTLVRRLDAIERMLAYYNRDVVDDLCGLPLEPIRHRKLDALAAEEAERARKAQEAADARRTSIRREAEQMLGSMAEDWLARRVETQGVSVLDYASGSDEALYTAQRWLATAAEKQRRARIAAEQVTALRADLTQAVGQAFSDPALAKLFLNSGHPKIGGRHPIDYCDNTRALSLLKSLLPSKR